MASAQFPAGVLLDASGNPFAVSYTPTGTPSSPAGASLPAGYGPTTIIVEPGGGRITLTESDSRQRTISYADIYASQPAVGMVVNKLVRQLSTLPLKVYERPPKGASQNGKPKHPEEITDPDHSLVSLLHNPAPGYGQVSLLEWISMPLFVHGNSVVAKFRGNGPKESPTELLPLDWRFMQAWARIGEPVIVWATVQTGQMKWIAPSEVVYTAWTSPAGANGAWLGVSPLAQLANTIKIDEAAQRYASATFKNAARPSGAVVLPAGVNVAQNPEIVDRLRDQIEGSYGGVDRAMRVMVLGGGADWKQLSQTAVEAQLTETRAWDWSEIRDLYDLPPNPDGTAEADAQLYKTTLRPHTVMIPDRIQAQLVAPEPEWAGLFVKLSMDEVLWGDPLVLSDKMVAEVLAGLRSVDEGRVPLGLDPRGGKSDLLLSDQDSSGAGPPGAPGGAGGPGGGPPPLTPEQQAMAEARTISAINKV